MSKVVIVFDNRKADVRLRTGWGFSAYVETPKRKILFDTGAGIDPLLHNLKVLDVPVDYLDWVILSHRHPDHTGGLGALPRRIPVVVPGKGGVGGGHRVVENLGVQDLGGRAQAVLVGGMLPEQFLVVPGGDLTLILCGCAHPGVARMTEIAAKRFPSSKFLLVGGFHLAGAPQDALNSLVKRLKGLGVEKVGPCHCSGQEAREVFGRAFKEGFVDAAAGTVIEF